MMRIALLLMLAPLVLMARGVQDVSNITTAEDVDLEEDSDSAGFMIVVEHVNQWRCTGSLLSQRTAVTTARCALGQESKDNNPHELWAFASALLVAQPPVPLAAAARRVARVALATAAPSDLKLALLELERPFDTAAIAVPILLATSHTECENVRKCNAVRALAAPQHRRVRLRVVDLALTDTARCADRVLRWRTPPRNLVCYAGDVLCENDMGGGVVCDGKLCAVLGDTAVSGQSRGTATGCSNTHVALAVTHWHHFLKCAHTLHLCGRENCANICSEQLLVPEDVINDDNDTQVVGNSVTQWSKQHVAATRSRSRPTTRSTHEAPTRSRASASSSAVDESSSFVASVGRSVIFEPNRADFKVTPSRTTLVRLKAGEYGDNVADYEGEESPVPPTRTSVAIRPSLPLAVSAPPPHEHKPPAPERRVSPPAHSAATSINSRHILITSVFYSRCIFYIL